MQSLTWEVGNINGWYLRVWNMSGYRLDFQQTGSLDTQRPTQPYQSSTAPPGLTRKTMMFVPLTYLILTMHPMCIRPGSHLISLPVYKWSESVIIESIEWNRNLKYASLYYLPCQIFHVLLNLKLIETRFVEKDTSFMKYFS